MPTDYTYPSVYFSYLFFFLSLAVAVYFFFRTRRDGYWGAQGEEPKYHLFDDDDPSRRNP
jgi:hypothetical protein